MKITVEVEVPSFHTVEGLAAHLAPEFARLVSNQCQGHAVSVVSASEEDSEPLGVYEVAEAEPEPKPAPKAKAPAKPRKPRAPRKPKD